jgi:hypothetical protein
MEEERKQVNLEGSNFSDWNHILSSLEGTFLSFHFGLPQPT